MGFLKSYIKPTTSGADSPPRPPHPSHNRNLSQGEKPQYSSTLQPLPPVLPSQHQQDVPMSNLSDRGTPTPSSPNTSRPSSYRPGSFYPVGNPEFRGSTTSLVDIKTDVMCNYVFQQQMRKHWCSGYEDEGVMIKKTRGDYGCFPPTLAETRDGFYDNVMKMNVRCAMTVANRVINVFVGAHNGNADYIPLPQGLRLQIIPTMQDLPACKINHFAAFVQELGVMIVWDDDPKRMINRADELQAQFMKFIWGEAEDEEDDDETPAEKSGAGAGGEMSEGEDAVRDLEGQAEERKIKLTSPLMVACTLTLMIVCMGFGWKNLALEIMVDGSYVRLALLAATPLQMFAGLFFFQSVIGNVFMIFGPIGGVKNNSKNYSGKAPRRLNRERQDLPHVTIQMPVYKEGLNGVIRPTVSSLKEAMSTYELQGGTANIFINDDGMQLIDYEKAEARREFYRENHIGWVARPGHNTNPEKGQVFTRKGKFKKASNMNYGLMISNKVEERLLTFERPQGWTTIQEALEYERALKEELEEHDGRAWADGNIRVGDYILIIDSDTRVPADCLLDAVSEMEQSPEVAIMQFTSGVMQVTTSYFENGITFFTNLVYSAITFAVANGDACPFVGHNAILRWSAIQEAASYHDEDGYEKFWSESHVSEDFDMALRMQCAGYSLRFASYTGPGFQEGVSLTVYDELARWEKYAFGCSELIFHPLKYWLFKGPITPLFRLFLFSGIHFPKKLTIMAYIGTYYALGASWMLTVGNYFLTGWYWGHFDKYYLDSFSIWVAIVVIFSLLGNVALAALRYRLGEKGLLSALWENFKWVPLLTIFLGGVSLHVSQALLSHLLSIDMNWGATAKEYVEVDFLSEVPVIMKKFKGTFLFCILATAGLVCGAFVVPDLWKITDFAATFPLALLIFTHFMLPVVLHPALMRFTW